MNNLLKRIGIALASIGMAVATGVAIGGNNVFERASANSTNRESETTIITYSTDGTDLSGAKNAFNSTGKFNGTNTLGLSVSSNMVKAYTGSTSGLRLGTSSAAGSIAMTVGSDYKTNVNRVKVNSGKWNNESTTYTVTVNSTSSGSVSSGTQAVVEFNSETTVNSISISCTRRMFITSIVIEYFSLASYDVTLSSGEGTGDNVSGGTTSGTLSAPACPNTFVAPEGKVFKGWKIGGEGTLYKKDDSITGISADITLVAIWDTPLYVTYNANGGSGTMTDDTTYFPNEIVEVQDNTFTKDGYIFTGWKIGDDDLTESTFTITEDTELVAQWETKVTLSFNGNGSTSGSKASIDYAINKVIQAPANPYTKTDCTFTGWNTADDGSGADYAVGDDITMSENITLYAQWIATEGKSQDPFTVAEARAKIDAGTQGSEQWWIRGYLQDNTTGSNYYTFNIVDSVNDINNTEAVNFKANGVGKNSMSAPKKGDLVVIQGKIQKNGTVYEVMYSDSSSKLYAIEEAESITEFELSGDTSVQTHNTKFTFDLTADVTYLHQGKIENVESNTLSFKIGSTTITTNTTMNHDNHDGETLEVTYTDSSSRKTAENVTLQVNYTNPESVSIAASGVTATDDSHGTMLAAQTATLTATVNAATANPAVEWEYTSSTLTKDTDYTVSVNNNVLSITSKAKSGIITATATSVGTPAQSATYVLTVDAEASVTLSDDALESFTGKTITASVASTKNIVGNKTYAWTVTSGTAATITSGAASQTATFTCGNSSGEVEFQVTVTGSTSGSATAVGTLSVTTSEITSISWTDAANIDVFEGSQLTVDMFTVTANWNNGDTNVPVEVTHAKLGNDLVELPYTLETTDSGKTLYAAYDGKVSSQSASVTVTEKFNDFTKHVEASQSFEIATSIAVGDTVYLVAGADKYEFSGVSSNIGQKVAYTDTPSKVCALTVEAGSTTGKYALRYGTDSYLALTVDDNKLNTLDSVEVRSSWTITFDDDHNAIIKNASYTGRQIQWNHGSPRFACYTAGGQTAVQLWKDVNIAAHDEQVNAQNLAAQKAAIAFINTFNTEIGGTCDIDGATATSTLQTKWGQMVNAFEAAIAGLSNETDKNNFKDLFKYGHPAEVVDDGEGHGVTPSGDSLEKMLARYNYVYVRYHESLNLGDFLHDQADRADAPASAFNGVHGNEIDASTTSMIVVISLVGVTAIGGYFFLKKRKEQ